MHLVIEGSPRTIEEARLLHDALIFYDRDPEVIYLPISRQESLRRLSGRGRGDDTKDGIQNRLEQYENQTLPVVDFFKNESLYTVHEIGGEQSIDVVKKDIKHALQ
jgi:adenylate kinase